MNMERGMAMLTALCEAAGLDVSSILSTVVNHASGASSPHHQVAAPAHSEVSTNDTK
jgi:uridine phosphorylase